MATIDDHILSMTSGARVDLFDVDLAIADGPVLRFTSNEERMRPSNAYRIEDASATGRVRATLDMTDLLNEGDQITVEGYARSFSGDPYCFIGFHASAPATDPRHGITLNTDTGTSGAYNSVNDTRVAENLEVHSSQAGEWVYFSLTVTIVNMANGANLIIYPGTGSAPGALPLDGIGAKDFYGIRAWRNMGPVRVPLQITRDLRDWEMSGAAIVGDGSDTAEITKVPVWGGNAYTPLAITAEGFAANGQGKFPTPTLSMSNITGAGSLLMSQYGDIRGAKVTRTQVYAENLDNGLNPDPAAFLAPEVYYITRRSSQNHREIVFELASIMDQQGVTLPRRHAYRDVCPWVYRSWNEETNQFDYDATSAGCPYTGTNYFDANGDAVVNPEDDKCSHKLTTGCRARYGTSEALPFGGFPMIGRFKA